MSDKKRTPHAFLTATSAHYQLYSTTAVYSCIIPLFVNITVFIYGAKWLYFSILAKHQSRVVNA